VTLKAGSDDEVRWWTQAFERQCREFLDDLLFLAPWCTLPPPSEPMWQRGSVEQVRRLSDLRSVLRCLDDVRHSATSRSAIP